MKTSEHLLEDHRVIEGLLRRLGEDVSAPDPGVLARTWSDFERRLFAHLEWEERFALPLVEAKHPGEIRAIRRDHDQIRKLVSALGVEVDLHSVSHGAVERLLLRLAEHANREDQTLYRWLGETSAAPAHHGLRGALRNVWRRVSARIGT